MLVAAMVGLDARSTMDIDATIIEIYNVNKIKINSYHKEKKNAGTIYR